MKILKFIAVGSLHDVTFDIVQFQHFMFDMPALSGLIYYRNANF